ncbi:MAG: M20/M25/M40 family metallo-hydrolase [Alphaproteobacteria bacterium]|nr:M20/M25/M40 family metallo-hydrolase [Alphaproteobacteria bacterium]
MDTEQVYQEAVTTLQSLIAIPSFSKEEEKAADYIQSLLRGWFPDCVSRIGNNLIVEIKGQAEGPTLLLCSHIDTVQVLDNWTRDPFGAEIDGDKIYGLGSNDAGASLVSLIAATRLMLPLEHGRILLCLVAEEETGPNGFVKIEPDIPHYDAAIFGEPTDLNMASSMRGGMTIRIVSRGIGCHASTPWEGKNAIDKFVQDMRAIRKIDLKDKSPWGGATIEPTVVQGGKSANQIPSLIETTLDVRTTPEKNNEWIVRALKKAGVKTEVLFDRRRPMHNPPDSKIVSAFREHYPDSPECVFNGSCDMAFSKAPSIILGPGSLKVAHIADEYASLSSIRKAITVYRNVIQTFTNG